MPSYYFSYDEWGYTFYETPYKLIENTPRIQDCYYYEGDVSEEDIIKDDDDYREIKILEHMEKENKKIHQEWEMEVDEVRAIYFRRMEDIKKLKEENKKLKETIKELQGILGECWTCGGCATHKEWRDALNEYELTCDICHRDEYPEQYDK